VSGVARAANAALDAANALLSRVSGPASPAVSNSADASEVMKYCFCDILTLTLILISYIILRPDSI